MRRHGRAESLVADRLRPRSLEGMVLNNLNSIILDFLLFLYLDYVILEDELIIEVRIEAYLMCLN